MPLKLMYITNRPDVAQIAQRYGVDRIFVDLEINGKAQRQKNHDTVLSYHTLDDLPKIRQVLTTSKLLTRVNPIFSGSPDEINRAIDLGSDLLMLPMFKTADEVKRFIDLVAGRVRTVCLVETKEAVEQIDSILAVPGVDEYYIGLNDLHLSYGLTFMFELLKNGVVEYLAQKFHSAGKPFGFGGVARINQGLLSSNYILAEHYRLQSSSVILSRAFCNTAQVTESEKIEEIFAVEVKKFRTYEAFLTKRDASFFEDTHQLLSDGVEEVKGEILKK